MEKYLKTTGIILRRVDFGEADQMLTILTQDQGKISVVAKGARRLKSRFLGKVELMHEVNLIYFQGRELGHLNEVECFSLVQDDLDLKSRGYLFYMAEATHKMVAEGQDSQRIYEHLKNALSHFGNTSSEATFYAYLIKLLTELGFMQDWSKCNETNSKLDLNKAYFISDLDGSLTLQSSHSSFGEALKPSVIKWVNYMQKEAFEELKNIIPTESERNEVFGILKSVMSTILNHPFKSEGFLKLSQN